MSGGGAEKRQSILFSKITEAEKEKKRRGMLLWGMYMIDGIVQVDEVDLIHGISRC